MKIGELVCFREENRFSENAKVVVQKVLGASECIKKKTENKWKRLPESLIELLSPLMDCWTIICIDAKHCRAPTASGYMDTWGRN